MFSPEIARFRGITQRLLNSPRVRGCTFFFSGGIGIGAWASCLPLLSKTMNLDEGQLGLLLLGFSCGAIASITTLGRFIDRLKSDRVSLIGGITFGLCICTMAIATASWQLAPIVCLAGVSFGALDVSMNTTASKLERELKRHMMSSFHATFSAGNLSGAFMAGTIISHGGGLINCLSAAGALVITVALLSRLIAPAHPIEWIAPSMRKSDVTQPTLLKRDRELIFLFGGISFLSMLAEGGVMDWSAVFLVKNLNASESFGAYAFGIFAGAVGFGRLLGDKLTQRIGHVLTIRLGGAICATSVAAMVISQSLSVAVVALAVCGIGLANMIPAAFSAAGQIGAAAIGRAMSIVKTLGYAGLLVGPALLGPVARTFGLTQSLSIVGSAFAFVATATFLVERRMRQHESTITA